MKLAKYREASGAARVGCVEGEHLVPLRLDAEIPSLAALLEQDDPAGVAAGRLETAGNLNLDVVSWLPPVDEQEVWAAGVTYRRSKTARMEESEAAASCYDRVYESPRPELFVKATPHRVAGQGQPLRIRADSTWNVPEPEVTLVLNSRLRIVGLTVGNDMSSRDIEGENPLYLPQAKVYDQCCGLGPWITLIEAMPPRDQIGIALRIRRAGDVVFSGDSGVDQMARSFEDLVHWLGRDNSFPTGAFLLTGTGIVPDSDFTLQTGDVVEITIDGVGCLSNPIIQSELRHDEQD